MMATKKKKIAANVVPFTGKQEQEDDQPTLEQIREMLVDLDDVEYDRQRKPLAAKWKVSLETLDKIRKQAARIRREFKPKEPEVDTSSLKSKLQPILDTEGILDLWIQSWDKVMAGEHRNAKLLYLIATSRLLKQPMHAVLKGPSAAGKSQIRKAVLNFFPKEDVIPFTTISEKALFWYEGEFTGKILSMGEATGLQEAELQNTLLRELMSEGVINYVTAQVIDGRVQSVTITKRGPCTFMVTTTRAMLHPENETRMLSLEVDDSPVQTRRVLKKLAQTVGRNQDTDWAECYRWQDYQLLLREHGYQRPGGWVIDVPFASALAALIGAPSCRFRRDYPQILQAVKAHALLHFFRRDSNERGELIADLELDYVPVAELIGGVVSEASDFSVEKGIRETVEAVKIVTIGMTDYEGATSEAVADQLGIDQSAAHRRLTKTKLKGYVTNLETKHGQPGKWRATAKEMSATGVCCQPPNRSGRTWRVPKMMHTLGCAFRRRRVVAMPPS
jgi:hypothetical protein